MRQRLDLDAYNVGNKKPPKWTERGIFWSISLVLILIDIYLIFMVAPVDRVQGQVYRVLYFHVPMALATFGAFGLVLLGSLMYLITRRPAWDRFAHGNAELGVLFTTAFIILGSLWAKPIWGVWWQWDPRLTTTLLMWLIYVSYLMVRAFAPTPAQAARYSAVVGIIGFVDVPIVYFATIWWRGVHPGMVVGPAAEKGALDPMIGYVLMFSMVAFAFLYAHILKERLSLARLQNDITGMIHALEDAKSSRIKVVK